MRHLIVLVVLVGCGKKNDDASHFAGWKAAETRAALQGAWVGPGVGNSMNDAAWEIKGDDVKVWNGKEEQTYKLVLEVPCKLGVKGSDGTTTYFGIVIQDGQALWSGGNAGYRKADHAVMCAGLETWTVEKGKCFEQSLSGRWKEAAGKCGFKKNAEGQEVFFWTWMDKEDTQLMDGDYLLPFKDRAAKKVADYAAAKAALPPSGQ